MTIAFRWFISDFTSYKIPYLAAWREILKVHAGKNSYRAEGAPNLGESGGMLPKQKIFKFGVSKMPSPAFSAGRFQYIKTKENVVISNLFILPIYI